MAVVGGGISQVAKYAPPPASTARTITTKTRLNFRMECIDEG